MRKLKDHYFRRAKKEGYLARSVYKLQELDRRYGIIAAGGRVLDLGSAPGSWAQYALKAVGRKGLVIAVDIEPLKWKTPANLIFLGRDVFQLNDEELEALSPYFDVILSDMAPSTTGIRERDARLSIELAERALQIAEKFLRPGGNFLAKVFEGPEFSNLLREVKSSFRFAKASKPPASRRESREIYLVGIGRRG